MIEEWRAIPGWPEYSASTLGRMRRDTAAPGTTAGRILKPTLLANGYYKVSLCRDAKRVEYTVHRLVALTFIGDPGDLHVCHNDGNRTNNRADNLRIDTRKGNMSDQLRHGTRRRGEAVPINKHSEQTMRSMLERAQKGERVCDLSAETGIPRTTLYALVSRRIWRHLDNRG